MDLRFCGFGILATARIAALLAHGALIETAGGGGGGDGDLVGVEFGLRAVLFEMLGAD